MENEKEVVSKNFIEMEIDKDLAEGVYDTVCTRFPPEPNGYLHIGHAKSILLNYGLAKKYNGEFHMRFDDTNPTKEREEFVESIKKDIQWLGADWGDHLYFASNYFDQMYEAAITLIKKGRAYCSDLNADQIREYRGTLTEPGKEDPNAGRSIEENLQIFEDMKNGNITDFEIEATKRAIVNGFRTSNDTTAGIDNWYSSQFINDGFNSIEELAAKYNAVTKEEIVEAAKKLTLDTVYVLKNK